MYNDPITINEEQARIIIEAPVWKPKHDLNYVFVSDLPEEEQREIITKILDKVRK